MLGTSGVAFFEAESHFSLGEMFPPLRVSQKLPAIEGIQYRALTAQRTHRAIASNFFHCRLPYLAQSLFPLLGQRHYDYATEQIWIASMDLTGCRLRSRLCTMGINSLRVVYVAVQ